MKTVQKTLMAGAVLAAGLILVDQTRAADINLQPWRKAKIVQPAGPPSNPGLVMTCPDCKTATVLAKRELVANKPFHGYKEVRVPVHLCKSCGDTLTRKLGTKEVAWVHKCSMPKSPSCCDASLASARGS